MKINIHILAASGRLGPHAKKLKSITNSVLNSIKKILPLSNIDIVFFDEPSSAIPELGISGYSPNAHTVYVYLDPTHKKFKETIQKELARTLAHESHHTARWKTVGYGQTLFEALITEGLAEHFDIEISKKQPSICAKALSDKKIKLFLKKAQKEFDNKNYTHTDWFFGSEKRKIPKWTGYTLGFYLVQKYLEKNPEQKASTLYSIEAKNFILV